jgi:NADP-dependent 3-hydroxy acid dehydrogenase YdfG
MLLDNKNAIVYGGSGAIGSAVARAFAREGARVFLTARRLEPLAEVAGPIRAAGGVAEIAQVDVCDRAAVERHAAQVADAVGGIDIAFDATGEAQNENEAVGTLLRRRPALAEVANVAVFLASNWASSMTATEVNLTAGAVVD